MPANAGIQLFYEETRFPLRGMTRNARPPSSILGPCEARRLEGRSRTHGAHGPLIACFETRRRAAPLLSTRGLGLKLAPYRRGAVAAISANSARICSLRSRLSSSVSPSASRMRSQSPPNLFDPEGAELDFARIGHHPVVELAVEGLEGLVPARPLTASASLATARGSGRGRPATIELTSAPTPSDFQARAGPTPP